MCVCDSYNSYFVDFFKTPDKNYCNWFRNIFFILWENVHCFCSKHWVHCKIGRHINRIKNKFRGEKGVGGKVQYNSKQQFKEYACSLSPWFAEIGVCVTYLKSVKRTLKIFLKQNTATQQYLLLLILGFFFYFWQLSTNPWAFTMFSCKVKILQLTFIFLKHGLLCISMFDWAGGP